MESHLLFLPYFPRESLRILIRPYARRAGGALNRSPPHTSPLSPPPHDGCCRSVSRVCFPDPTHPFFSFVPFLSLSSRLSHGRARSSTSKMSVPFPLRHFFLLFFPRSNLLFKGDRGGTGRFCLPLQNRLPLARILTPDLTETMRTLVEGDTIKSFSWFSLSPLSLEKLSIVLLVSP